MPLGCLALVRAAAAGQQLSLLGSMPGMAWHGTGERCCLVRSSCGCRLNSLQGPKLAGCWRAGFSGQRAVCAELCVCVGLDIQSCAVCGIRRSCAAVCGCMWAALLGSPAGCPCPQGRDGLWKELLARCPLLARARFLVQHPRCVVDAGALWLQHKGRVFCGALTSGCTAAGVVWRHVLPDQFQAGHGHMHNNGLPGAW